MTDYKKEAPSSCDNSAAFTIENYLALISEIAELWTGKILRCETDEVRESMHIIIDYCRLAWDLVPDEPTLHKEEIDVYHLPCPSKTSIGDTIEIEGGNWKVEK